MVYSMDFVGFVTDCRKTNPFGVVKIQMPKNKHIDFFFAVIRKPYEC